VDFSDRCRTIAPIVRQTAEMFDAHLILLNAIDPMPLAMGEAASMVAPLPDFFELRRRQERLLKEFEMTYFDGMKPTVLVEDGEAGSVVTNVIRHQGVDLVMLPTHGHGAVRRFLLGSVTAKILHDVDCAVWTDAHQPEARPVFPYHRILCSLNVDSEEAAAVLKAACSVATAFKAELSLIHVVETPPAAWDIDYSVYRDDLVKAADEKMRRLREQTGVLAPYKIDNGQPSAQVGEAAKALVADLVVTGRGHAQSGLGRLWSSLYSIVREAPCPVLSI
jgi:nucleotide-binding universal stress UspA family protein